MECSAKKRISNRKSKKYIFLVSTALHAIEYGCIGLILYSDPIDVSVPWDGVYPDSWYLPPTGAERGSVTMIDGDPRSPNYPSIRKSLLKTVYTC